MDRLALVDNAIIKHGLLDIFKKGGHKGVKAAHERTIELYGKVKGGPMPEIMNRLVELDKGDITPVHTVSVHAIAELQPV